MRLRLQVLLTANSGNIEENKKLNNKLIELCLRYRVVLLILKNIASRLRNIQAEAKKCVSYNKKKRVRQPRFQSFLPLFIYIYYRLLYQKVKTPWEQGFQLRENDM